MKIEQSTVRKINISEIDRLDPISIYLEDYEPRKGKITISCYDKSWHSYWGGMGDRTIDKFFLSCDNHYLSKNLSNIKSNVNDYDALCEKIKEEKQDGYLHDEIESLDDDCDWDAWIRNNTDVMTEVFGEEWWYDIPTKENHEYAYLCRIIDVVKNVLRENITV